MGNFPTFVGLIRHHQKNTTIIKQLFPLFLSFLLTISTLPSVPFSFSFPNPSVTAAALPSSGRSGAWLLFQGGGGGYNNSRGGALLRLSCRLADEEEEEVDVDPHQPLNNHSKPRSPIQKSHNKHLHPPATTITQAPNDHVFFALLHFPCTPRGT